MNNSYLLNSIKISNISTIVGYVFCAFFIIIGLIIIIKNNSTYKNTAPDNNKDIDKIINKKIKNNIEKTFNPDSIFKKIPNFSNKIFFETTINDLKKELKTDDIKTTQIKLIDFEEVENTYLIISSFKTKEKNYLITSTKEKNINTIVFCPTCGGKVKDQTLLRCKHCDTILPKRKNSTSNNWIITNIKEIL